MVRQVGKSRDLKFYIIRFVSIDLYNFFHRIENMKFLALSALAAFGFLAQESQATLISNNLFPNFGSENALQVPTGSNPLFSGSSSPFSFGSQSQQPLNNFGSPLNFQQFPSFCAFNPQNQFRPNENLPNPNINLN